MSHYRDEEDALGADIPYEGLEDEVGCHYPGRCAILTQHIRAVCAPLPQPQGRRLAEDRRPGERQGTAL